MGNKAEEYSLTEYGRELVAAMPNRKKVEAVKRKYARKKRKVKKRFQ